MVIKLSADDFVIQDRVCRFAGGSKSHSNVPRSKYDKICLFDDDTTRGLLRHIFSDGRKTIGNERKSSAVPYSAREPRHYAVHNRRG